MAKRWEGSELKCSPLNMKCTTVLRAKLEEAARVSGRCLTEEVLYRGERSFERDDTLDAVREAVREEMRAEFTARLPRPFDPHEYMLANGMERV